MRRGGRRRREDRSRADGRRVLLRAIANRRPRARAPLYVHSSSTDFPRSRFLSGCLSGCASPSLTASLTFFAEGSSPNCTSATEGSSRAVLGMMMASSETCAVIASGCSAACARVRGARATGRAERRGRERNRAVRPRALTGAVRARACEECAGQTPRLTLVRTTREEAVRRARSANLRARRIRNRRWRSARRAARGRRTVVRGLNRKAVCIFCTVPLLWGARRVRATCHPRWGHVGGGR